MSVSQSFFIQITYISMANQDLLLSRPSSSRLIWASRILPLSVSNSYPTLVDLNANLPIRSRFPSRTPDIHRDRCCHPHQPLAIPSPLPSHFPIWDGTGNGQSDPALPAFKPVSLCDITGIGHEDLTHGSSRTLNEVARTRSSMLRGAKLDLKLRVSEINGIRFELFAE